MKDRIAHILKIKNLTATRFADELEVQRSGISHILSGRNKPSLDFIIKIKDTYPEFSLDWLILGKGPATLSPPSGDHKQTDKSYSLFGETTEYQDERVIEQAFTERHADMNQHKTDEFENRPHEMKAKKENPKSLDSGDATTLNAGDIERVMLFYTNKTFEIYRPKGQID